MPVPTSVLEALIDHFSEKNFQSFLQVASETFTSGEEDLQYIADNFRNFSDKYKDIKQLGHGQMRRDDGPDLRYVAVSVRRLKDLNERSSKREQFELAREILKRLNADAGYFAFYDDKGRFRFSFVYSTYDRRGQHFSSWKRMTYFVSPTRTNKTFRQQIQKVDFDSLTSVKEAFSVEPVTREFYQKLQDWYFWALQEARFPSDVETLERNGKQVATIRLITRMMFLWFMRVRGLVPKELFDEKFVNRFLKDFDPQGDTDSYYKAFLQNLFFATLSVPMKDRSFRSEERFQGKNKDYGNCYVFRYRGLFEDDLWNNFLSILRSIPFLNGGLFECLDRQADPDEEQQIRRKRIYIDGFTDRREFHPHLPDALFFAPEHKADILTDTGKTHQLTVQGLIQLFNDYNFTTDENDPNDIEVALDPELLGRVFENLLARYNPETASNARKATGSYYTPRNVVDYMVNEALLEYFRRKLEIADNDREWEQKMNTLLRQHQADNPFDEATSGRIVKAIDELHIVDPAVGSGAFPMAILNKLVHILRIIDPGSRRWIQRQIQGVRDSITDPVLRNELIDQIHKETARRNDDYGRKLYLIQKVIYGVDLQQTAVEIAKLRFFISLLVDENINPADTENNLGVRPLPNLDFKIMQGNSLIEDYQDFSFSRLDALTAEGAQLIEEIDELKTRYATVYLAAEKQKLRKQIEDNIIRLARIYLEFYRQDDWTDEMIEAKLRRFRQYISGHKPRDFFPWKLFFGEVFKYQKGFDIVIGNPPYIQLQKALDNKQKYADLYKDLKYKTFDRTGDIYTLFYELGINIARPGGLVVYITSNKWMRAKYGEKLRRFLGLRHPIRLIDLGPGVFENATVDTNILLVEKPEKTSAGPKSFPALKLEQKTDLNRLTPGQFERISFPSVLHSAPAWIILSPIEEKIKERIEQVGIPLKDWNININYGIKTGYNEAFIIDGATKDRLIEQDPKSDEIIKPILRGRDIKRYKVEFADRWLINTHNGYHKADGTYVPPVNVENYPAIKAHLDQYWPKLVKRHDQGRTPYNLRDCAYMEEFEKEKIVYMEIQTDNEKEGYPFPAFAYGEKDVIVLNTAYIMTGGGYKYILAVLNSKLGKKLTKYYVTQLQNRQFRMLAMYVSRFPIPKIPSESQKPFETLVDYIIAAKDLGLEKVAAFWERMVDALVYVLYFAPEAGQAGTQIREILSGLPPLPEQNQTAFLQEITARYRANAALQSALEKLYSLEEVKTVEAAARR